MNVRDRQFVSPEIASGPVHRHAYFGNAGGKHYAIQDAGGRTFGPDPARPLIISGTSEPLHLYGINVEASKSGSPDITVNMEIVNSSNVRHGFVHQARRGREEASPTWSPLNEKPVALSIFTSMKVPGTASGPAGQWTIR